MGETSEVLGKPILDKMDKLTGHLGKTWAQVQKDKDEWNFRDFTKTKAAYASQVAELTACWPECESRLEEEVAAHSAYVRTETYAADVEQALREAGIPLQGSYPEYEFPPFKLVINIEGSEVKLSMGRRSERTTAIQPHALAAWVSKQYKKVVGKKFDSEKFMNDLLNAYKIANRLAYREKDVLWGKAVGLDVIYDLLTIKRTTKTDYQKPLFNYELARLKEQFDLKMGEYTFELGMAKNQSKALTIIDSLGRESRVSSLAIYAEKEKAAEQSGD